MRRIFLAGICAFGALSASACSHTYFQYHPAAPESDAISSATGALLSAGASKSTADVGPRLDPDGRVATIFAAHDLIAMRHPDVIAPLDGFLTLAAFATFFSYAFGDSPMDDAFYEHGFAWAKAEVEKAVALSLLGHSGDAGAPPSMNGVAPSLLDEFSGSTDVRRARLATMFVGDLPLSCKLDKVLVSYRASILDHVEWNWAQSSKRFLAWKESVRAIHFLQLGCDGKVGLWMMDSYATGDPLLVGWHYFTPEEWTHVEPKLRAKLELDR